MQSLARLADKEDDCKGTFWQSRYKSIPQRNLSNLVKICPATYQTHVKTSQGRREGNQR